MNEHEFPDDQPRHLPPPDEADRASLPAADPPPDAPATMRPEAASDVPAPDPAAATPAAQGAKPTKHALPETLTAAQDAKAFVAQLFADAAPSESAEPPALLAQEPAESAESEPAELADTPAYAPVSQLQGLHVLVLGLGASGIAMVRWCVRRGARVSVADTREAPPQLATLQAELPQVDFRAGAFEAALVEGTDIRAVFRSPGLTPAMVAPVWQPAQAMGLWLGGELDLFAAALRELQAERAYAPQVLAVTGTNGKTTTTALTRQLVELAGKSVAMAGNIGPNLLDVLARHLDEGTLPEVWVLELSSFQLDGVQGFEPTASVLLNLTQDHLDWHGDMAAYGAAKARIFGSRGLIVLNRNDAAVMALMSAAGPPQGAKRDGTGGARLFGTSTPAQAGSEPRTSAPAGGSAAHEVASVGAVKAQPVRAKLQKPKYRDHVTFGADMPQRPGDYGIELVNGMAWLVRAQEADETLKRRRRSAGPSPAAAAPSGGSAAHAVASVGTNTMDEEDELFIQRLMPADALRIRGRHNATNALAALALAQAIGCPLGPMLYGLREYRGEPHRVEPIGIVDEVEYFDDSKGTNVGATVAALNGLGVERRVVVILGGDGKGQDFSPLAEPVQRYARAVVLIGRDAPVIRAAVQNTGVPLLDARTMPEAVNAARAQAQPGDAVLLSPACASFDMFDNYPHRARVFIEAVQAIATDAGQDLGGQT